MRVPLREYWGLFAVYLRPLRRQVLLLAILLFSSIGLRLVNPQVVRYFIDAARTGTSQRVLIWAALIFIGTVMLQQILGVVASYVSENIAWASTNALRHDLAQHCLELDMSFHNTHAPGEMIERIDGDVTTLASFFSQFVFQVLANALLMIGTLAMLFAVDWRIGLILTLFAGTTLAVLNQLRGISIPAWIAGRQASAEMAGFLEEHMAATEDVRSSRATDYVMYQFYGLMRSIMYAYRRAFLLGAIAGSLARFAVTVALAIGLALGAYFYSRGAITLGAVYLTSYYTGMLAWPIFQITNQIDDLQQASAGLARVNRLRATPITIRDGSGVAPPLGPLTVEFDDVGFGYGADEPVVEHISFRLRPGEALGLLGRTGSGKTTISRLLFRLYDPQGGRISLSGVDIRNMRLNDLRRRIGLVTQEVQLFHASVRENLTFFDETASEEQIMGAIEELGLTAWYRTLPQGLDTELRGSSGLSAGEAQMLAMTRVFLKDPDIIVLDEASSRLDPATEGLIEHAMDRLLSGKTAIVIAHRLGTVQRTDRIMILSEGVVAEYGEREALVTDSGSRFSQLLRTGLELELA